MFYWPGAIHQICILNTSPAANTNTAACLSDLLQLPNWIQLLAINYLALQSKADYLSICPAALSIFRDFRNKRAREDRTALLIINVSQTNVSVTNMFVLDYVLLRVSRLTPLSDSPFTPPRLFLSSPQAAVRASGSGFEGHR